MSTATDVQAAIAAVDAVLGEALPMLGLPELIPIADALALITEKVAQAVATANPLPAEIAVADQAAQLLEDKKFPKS